jgi:hypothetical protein
MTALSHFTGGLCTGLLASMLLCALFLFAACKVSGECEEREQLARRNQRGGR